MNRRVSRTIPQGVDEAIRYRFDFTELVAVHGDIESVACTLWNEKRNQYDAGLLSGAATFSGADVTSQTVSGVEARTKYILSVACTFADGDVLSATLPIMGEV